MGVTRCTNGSHRTWCRSRTIAEELEWLVGEGDFVAWRSRGRGTHTGPLGPFPPTHKSMDVVIIGMHRFDDGLVAETWTSWDNAAVLAQLGLMPAM